jgi:hypothetical protein
MDRRRGTALPCFRSIRHIAVGDIDGLARAALGGCDCDARRSQAIRHIKIAIQSGISGIVCRSCVFSSANPTAPASLLVRERHRRPVSTIFGPAYLTDRRQDAIGQPTECRSGGPSRSAKRPRGFIVAPSKSSSRKNSDATSPLDLDCDRGVITHFHHPQIASVVKPHGNRVDDRGFAIATRESSIPEALEFKQVQADSLAGTTEVPAVVLTRGLGVPSCGPTVG